MAEVDYGNLLKIGWGYKIELNKKGHPIGQRVWETLSDMEGYLKDPNSSAVPGILLVVTSDPDESNNGAYLVKKVNGIPEGNTTPVYVKLSTGASVQLDVPTDVAHITADGKLHIEDMRTYWDEKSFQDN